MKQLTPRLNRLEPNIVIDGGMEIWPEGNSRSIASGSGAYGAVLFSAFNDASSVTITNSQQASVPSGTNLSFSNQISKTVAGTLAAGTSIGWRYQIEGYDIQKLMSDEFSIIFWVKSSVAGNRSLSARNAPSGFGSTTHSFVQQYTINSADTWELKVLKIPKLSDCPGALNRTNNIGIVLNWMIIGGSNLQTASLNQWVSGNFVAGIGEDTTWLTGTTHNFSIAGVMVLPGDWTALESNTAMYRFLKAGRSFADELAMSQRYFEKSYNLSVSPGTITGSGALQFVLAQQETLNEYRFGCRFATSKRDSPSMTLYSTDTGAAGFAGTNAGDIAITVGNVGEAGFTGQLGAGHSSVNGFQYQYKADARF